MRWPLAVGRRPVHIRRWGLLAEMWWEALVTGADGGGLGGGESAARSALEPERVVKRLGVPRAGNNKQRWRDSKQHSAGTSWAESSSGGGHPYGSLLVTSALSKWGDTETLAYNPTHIGTEETSRGGTSPKRIICMSTKTCNMGKTYKNQTKLQFNQRKSQASTEDRAVAGMSGGAEMPLGEEPD
ncbi:hypothetical protein NDU88_006892 [Pleurodeles waltl]|uniref:Uncharacterized protein n=1 Tax=Pleurodeles waltl TaxID=8319 RepID=A0AAV7WBX5_PLEWA|nr:hypothetical protein NDU88_006892 [Pleurodeles waltl]